MPVATLLEIGDALLASPILIMQVTLNCDAALGAVTLLRERFGEHMLIGTGSVQCVDHLHDAIAAGAQFTMSNTLDLPTVEQALAEDFLHLPGVNTYAEARLAQQAGSKMVGLNVDDDRGPQLLQTVRSLLSEIEYMPLVGASDFCVREYRFAGAAAVCVSGSLVTGPDQPMDDLITKARRLRSAWLHADLPENRRS